MPAPASHSAAPTAPARAGPELSFAVESAATVELAAAPAIAIGVRIERVGGGPIRSIALNTQVRIAATRRSYDDREEERLAELFGRPEQWDRSLRSLLWANQTANVPAFTDSTLLELPVPCTYDLEVTSGKYFHALEDGEVPLELLFSGTVFYPGDGGLLQVSPIPWDREAEYRLPVRVWRETMDRYFPDSAWLRIGRDGFDRLCAYRGRNALPSWDATFDRLLREADGEDG